MLHSVWRPSITLSADFRVEALEEAHAHHDRPETFNTDQGSRFTGIDFITVLKDARIAISIPLGRCIASPAGRRDGKGAWRDSVFVERFWRTVKHKEVYPRACSGVSEARASIGRHLGFQNGTRPHSSLGGRTPDQAHPNRLTPIPAAA